VYFCRIDFDKHIIETESFLKNAVLESDYVMNGKFLVLPIKGNGKCRMEFSKYISFVGADLWKVNIDFIYMIVRVIQIFHRQLSRRSGILAVYEP
jgi:hypothetical protein